MKISTEQKKNLYYFLFEFSSVEACFQEKAYIEKPALIPVGKKNRIGVPSNNFFIWGFSDILRLFVFNQTGVFTALQRLKPVNNVYDLKCYSGFSYIKGQFEFAQILKDYPLIGISFLKFKDNFFKDIKRDKYTTFIFEFLNEKIKVILKNKKEDSYIFPIISYGWEDIILVFFSKSYDLIKETILGLRKIEAEEIKKANFLDNNLKNEGGSLEFKHIFMSTFTILGTYFPDYSKGGMYESANKLKLMINHRDRVYVSGVKFQVRPGHESNLKETLENKLKEKLGKKVLKQINIKPLPYRRDLLLSFKEKLKFYEFLDYYPIIFDVMQDSKTPIISLETGFVIDEDLLKDPEPSEVETEIPERSIIDEMDIQVIKWLNEEKILEQHSLLGFINLITDASFFENHYFVKQTMLSWINTIKTLENYLINTESNLPSAEIFRGWKDEIYSDIEDFINLLSISFADRFRGTYPVGETATLPLLTYKVSLQKFLICIDHMCVEIFKELLTLFDQDLQYPNDFSFCSFFTTGFSPAISPFMWKTYLLHVPDIFIYNITEYLLHEIGHSFWEYFEYERLIEIEDQVKRFKLLEDFDEFRPTIIEEILCDYLALCVVFGGDYDKFKSKFYQLTRAEEVIRSKAVKWLYENISISQFSELPFSTGRYKDVLNHLLFSLVTTKSSLKTRLEKLKNSSFFPNFSYEKLVTLFERENWIDLFLRSFGKI